MLTTEQQQLLNAIILHEPIPSLLLTSEIFDFQEEDGRTPLHIATLRGQTERIKDLIKCGINPNVIDNHKHTPLHFVQNVPDAKILLEAGANLHTKDYFGKTPFAQAIEDSNTPYKKELVKYFVEKGANPNIYTGDYPTVLSYAISTKDPKFIEFLLQKGLNLIQPHYAADKELFLKNTK